MCNLCNLISELHIYASIVTNLTKKILKFVNKVI